ncbi:hypothetical protein SCMU_31020 [Sinomonas cyclohexanicum]|uniref:Uncharacterized protein n=1 Tax=Sinomonas cyclohexanicum TaxID=322009 RepID=A0ABN6FLT1_SINCY|nr:hypothetical protein [Corynebacterium cyclohexanicum]BCT77260.1 hypothetical protein SCMU_31020 [Corynebacterium cyclohexanicum]
MATKTARTEGTDGKDASPKRSIAGRAVAAAGGVVAAATLATGIAMAPAPSAAARLDGVHEDLARAVALRQITDEQAAFFEAQIARAIATEESSQTHDDAGAPSAETA